MSKISDSVFLTSSDYDNIIQLWQQAELSHRPLGRDSRQNIERQMQLENTRFMGLFDNEILIAAAIASHNGRKGWINRLAVHPDYRHQKIATRLIRFCEEWLLAEGIEITAVLIETDNPNSMKLFTNSGYIRHDDIIYFTKRINNEV